MHTKEVELLEKIKDNSFDFTHVNEHDLADHMIKNIGHPNSHIRDDLIYECLAHLFHENHFDENHLTRYLNILLDSNHLTYDMENETKNSVLTRSFSILQLVIFIYVHNRDDVLKRIDIENAFTIFLDYFSKENMLEGYNKDVGWIHAIAHSADLFNQFMHVKWFKKEELEMMFEAIAHKMKQSNQPFNFNEEERMAVAIKSGIKRNLLSKDYIVKWVANVARQDDLTQVPEKIYLANNSKHFLRSIYFKLIDEDEYQYITDTIKEKLKTLK